MWVGTGAWVVADLGADSAAGVVLVAAVAAASAPVVAVILGAAAPLEVGDVDKTEEIYQTPLGG